MAGLTLRGRGGSAGSGEGRVPGHYGSNAAQLTCRRSSPASAGHRRQTQGPCGESAFTRQPGHIPRPPETRPPAGPTGPGTGGPICTHETATDPPGEGLALV